MIKRDDILSMEYLKKTEFTGCHKGMRYRLEKVEEETGKKLKVTVWPEPFNFFTTPPEEKQSVCFSFSEEGVEEAVAWMNERLTEDAEKWDHAAGRWDTYQMK